MAIIKYFSRSWPTGCPEYLEIIWLVHKRSRWSRNCPDDLGSVQMIWQVSKWFEKCPDDLKSVQEVWKCPDDLKSVQMIHILPIIDSDSFFQSYCHQNCYLTHFCCKFHNVAVYALYTDIFCVENAAVRKFFAFSDSAIESQQKGQMKSPQSAAPKCSQFFLPHWSWIDAKNGTYIVSYIPQNY